MSTGQIYEFQYGSSGYSRVGIFQLPEEKKTSETKEGETQPTFKDFSLRASFAPLYLNSRFSDVVFLVGDKQIPAHRLILSRASPFFESMLYSRLSNGNFDVTVTKIPLQIKIKDTDPESFESMLKLIYKEEIDINNLNVQSLMKLAAKYQVPKLQGVCLSYMESGISEDSVLEMYEMGPKIFGDESFGLKFISEHIQNLIKKPSFLKLSEDRLLNIVKCESLHIDEFTLFEAVLAWADAKIQESIVEGLTRKQLLRDIVHHIRFPLMDLPTIAKIVTPTGILSPEQLVEIFAYLSVPDEKARSVLSNPGFPTSPRKSSGPMLLALNSYIKSNPNTPRDSKLITVANSQSIKDLESQGYSFLRTEAYIFASSLPNTLSLELWYRENISHYIITTQAKNNRKDLNGYKFVRIEGYVYERPQSNTIALCNYVNSSKYHRLIGNPQSISTATFEGYRLGRTEGYGVNLIKK